jgi:hypothetical protein
MKREGRLAQVWIDAGTIKVQEAGTPLYVTERRYLSIEAAERLIAGMPEKPAKSRRTSREADAWRARRMDYLNAKGRAAA